MISNSFDFAAMRNSLFSLDQETNTSPQNALRALNFLNVDDSEKILLLAENFLRNGSDPNLTIHEVWIGDNIYLYPTFFHVVYLYWKAPDMDWNKQADNRFGVLIDKMLNDPRIDLGAKFTEQSLCDCEHFIDLTKYRKLQAEDGYLLEGVNIAHYAMAIGDFEMVDKVLEKAPQLLHSTCCLSKGKGLFSLEEYVNPALEITYPVNYDFTRFRDKEELEKIKNLHDDEIHSGVVAWGATDRASYLEGIMSPIIRTTKVSLLHLSARLGDEFGCGYLRGKKANFAALDSNNRTPFDYYKLSLLEDFVPFNSSTKRMVSILKPISRIHQPYLPQTQMALKREGYEIIYDTRTKIAHFVYQRLTKNSLQKNADRGGSSFKVDHEIPQINRAKHSDYTGSGFQKGHLVPAADAVSSEIALEDTFYFSNAFPQIPSFNQGYWKSVERYVRELVNTNDVVEVFTGPLFVPQSDAYGRKKVSYETIGNGNIAAPTHVFKVVYLHNQSTTSFAIILPNAPIHSETSLNQFQVTIEKVQELSGILFSSWRP